MFVVGICDCCEQDVRIMSNIVEKTVFSQDEMHIQVFHSGQELIKTIEKSEFSCDVLLLEISLTDMSGLAVAAFVRERQLDVDIIFVTHSTEYVFEGYTYKAYAYVLKEKMSVDLRKSLLRYMEEQRKNQGTMTVTVGGLARIVPIASILYIESNTRILTAHLKHEEISFYGKLGDVENSLVEKGFVRTHQSYLVRGNLIKQLSREGALLAVEDAVIPVSRKYYEQVKSVVGSERNGR